MTRITRSWQESREIALKILHAIPGINLDDGSIAFSTIHAFVSSGDTDYCDACCQTGTLFKLVPPNRIITDRCLCQIMVNNRNDVNSKLAMSNIPVKYRSAKVGEWQNTGRTLDEVASNQKSIEGIKTYVSRLPEMITNGIGLFLCGPNGVGKTFLASAIGIEAITQGYATSFYAISEIISLTVQGWYDEEKRKEMINDVEQVNMLIIDDCDKVYKTKAGLETMVFDNMFRKRVQNNMPVIFTSNNSLADVEKSFNHSVLSMFLDQSIELPIVGDDFRKKINANLRKSLLG